MTPYEEIYDLFLTDIKEDTEFFYYESLTEEEQLALTKEKCKKLLLDSVSEFLLNCTPEVDFNNRDDNVETFNFDLVNSEKQIFKRLMIEKHLEQDVLKLKVYSSYFKSKELEVFSPANNRDSFMKMYDNIFEKNRDRIKQYASKDRATGKMKTLNYDIM